MEPIFLILAGCLLAALLVRLIIPNILIISLRKRLFDLPDFRKVHQRPVAVLVVGFFALSGVLANLPFIGCIFERASNREQLLAADSWQTEVGLQPSMLLLLCLLAAMIVGIYRGRRLDKDFPRLYVFVNLNLLLLLMMLVCNVFGMYYLLMRYFFYLYAFQNTLFVIYLHESGFLQQRSVRWPLVGLLMCYFFYSFSHHVFSYIPVVEAFVYPLPIYLFI